MYHFGYGSGHGSPRGSESYNIKEALKCSSPFLFFVQERPISLDSMSLLPPFPRHGDDQITVSFKNDLLFITLKRHFKGCNKHLTGIWISIFQEGYGNEAYVFDQHVPSKCFVEDHQSNSTHVALLLPSPTCNLTLGELVVCRTYAVRAVMNFRSLMGMTFYGSLFVPPKVIICYIVFKIR